MAGGMELHFSGLWNFKIRSLKFDQNRSFCGIAGIFLQISAPEKDFPDSGKWPFHTPPIHTPTKCRPNTLREGKPGWIPNQGFHTLLGKGPDCVADPFPFGNVPCRCFLDRVSPTQTRLRDYQKITAQGLPCYLRIAEARFGLLL